jgi:hypothetical protein
MSAPDRILGVWTVRFPRPLGDWRAASMASWLARLWAAILYAGPGAVLSHETAAEIDGLIDTRSADIHLTVPGPRRVQKVAGIQIHRSRRLGGLRFPPGEIPGHGPRTRFSISRRPRTTWMTSVPW